MKNSFFYIFNKNQIDVNVYLKIRNLFLSLILIYIGICVSAVIIFAIDYFIIHFLSYESVKDLFTKSNKLVSKRNVFYIALIGPFIEELMFRLPLRINRLYFTISVILFSYLLIGGKVETFDYKSIKCYAEVIGALMVGIISYYLLIPNCIDILQKYRKHIIWLSIIGFGLIHLINISKVGQIHWQLSFFYPFFVLPYIVMGYFMTNLRLKYGFIWGFLLHVLLNSIATIIGNI